MGRSRGNRTPLPRPKVSSRTAISEWFCLESQARVSNRLSVKKNRRFLDFYPRLCRFEAAEVVTAAGKLS